MNTTAPQRITEDLWRSIIKTLPKNCDATHVRTELERIACDDRPPMARAKECEERAHRNRYSLQLIERGSALAEALAQQIRLDDEQARVFREIAQQRLPRKFLRQYGILEFWEISGGSLKISTPEKAQPYGPVIDYFRAAAAAIFGESLSISQTKKIVSRYRHLKFATASWGGAMGGYIDDSKVFVIPGAPDKKP
jgi:hypothetical protein